MTPAQRIGRDFKESGFSILSVHDEAGTFTYSVGFTEFGMPEVIICGLGSQIAARFLWDIYHAYQEGRRFPLDTPVDELANLPCVFKAITAESAREFCCQAVYWYEGEEKKPTFIQMVLPDREGLFPWQKGYDAELMRCQRHLWPEIH